MIRPVLAACLFALVLGGCATSRNSGSAIATVTPDGAIALKTRGHGLFGETGETVTFQPGEPGYEAMKTQIELLGAGKRRPVLTWTIGEPELTLPPGR